MKMIKVTWVDSCLHQGWKDKDYVAKPVKVTTVGYKVSKGSDYISVALNLDEYGQVADIMSIPMDCVNKVETVK